MYSRLTQNVEKCSSHASCSNSYSRREPHGCRALTCWRVPGRRDWLQTSQCRYLQNKTARLNAPAHSHPHRFCHEPVFPAPNPCWAKPCGHLQIEMLKPLRKRRKINLGPPTQICRFRFTLFVTQDITMTDHTDDLGTKCICGSLKHRF